MKEHDWVYIRTDPAEHDYSNSPEGQELDPQAVWRCKRCELLTEVDAPHYRSEADIDIDGYFRGMIMGYDGSADPPSSDHFSKCDAFSVLDDCDSCIALIVMQA